MHHYPAIFSPWQRSQTFLCHESHRLEFIPQSPKLLPCNPSLLSFNCPKLLASLAGDSAVFNNLNSFQHVPYSYVPTLLRLATVHQFRSHSVAFSIFPISLPNISVLCIALCLQVLAASSTPHASKNPRNRF